MKKIGLLLLIILNFNLLCANEKVSLQLNWLHQFQFAGYYMAKEKGFYKEAGFDVDIKEYSENIDVLKDVIGLKSDFGISNSSIVLDAFENKNITLVSAFLQNSPMVLISTNTNDDVKKLKDKLNILSLDKKLSIGMNAMVVSNRSDFKHTGKTKYSFRVGDLVNNKTDVMIGFLSNEPYILDKIGVKYTIHNPNSYDLSFYDGILFASKKLATKDPLKIRRFKEASLKGWEYAFEHIKESAKLIYEKYNTQNKTLDALIYEGKVLKELSGYKNNLLGKIQSQKIKEIKRLLTVLPLDKDLNNSSGNDFIFDLNHMVSLNQKEKAYLNSNVIKLLSNNQFKPFAFKAKNGEVVGIEIEYWKLINEKLKNLNYTIKEVLHSKDAIKIIKEDKNSIKYAYSRLDNDKFLQKTKVIFSIPMALGTLKGQDYINDLSKLEGKKVAIYKNLSTYQALVEKYPNIIFVPANSTNEAAQMVKDKKVFGVALKLPRLSYKIHKKIYSFLKITGVFDVKHEFRFAINKENKMLIDLINRATSSITEEDREDINSKYYYVLHDKNVDYSWIYKVLLPILVVLAVFIAITIKLSYEIKRRKNVELKLQKIANVDALTNIYNRRKIENLCQREIEFGKRYKKPFSVIFFDIDDFKQINDVLGHKVGDDVLVKISSLVLKNIRKIDYFGRWGGEEFLILLPQTDMSKAEILAKHIRKKIVEFDFGTQKSVTCSFGVSEFRQNETLEDLMKRADDALYFVKTNGKNGVKSE